MSEELREYYDDKPREACGLAGVFATDPVRSQEIVFTVLAGLAALQQRGQDAAGIAAGNGRPGRDGVHLEKGPGLVSQVFYDVNRLRSFGANIVSTGHVLYATAVRDEASVYASAHPIEIKIGNEDKSFFISCNGHISNQKELCVEMGWDESEFLSDTDFAGNLISYHYDSDSVDDDLRLFRAVTTACRRFDGAFSFLINDENTLIAARDKRGMRPLVLGKFLGSNDYAVASETPAIDEMGATLRREINPGEVMMFSESGLPYSEQYAPADPNLCSMEYIYFARPDGKLRGKDLYSARKQGGRLLAERHPVEADLVIGVPESGIPAAQGFAEASGIYTEPGIVKNRYIARTFIAPSQEEREALVRQKFHILEEVVRGKRVVLVDDSIVRGTTMKVLVQMLRDAGATEVHLRLSSPPYKWPCFYGMATADRDSLLAANLSDDEIARFLSVNSIGYSTPSDIISASDQPIGSLCMACFTGEYPTPVDLSSPRK